MVAGPGNTLQEPDLVLGSAAVSFPRQHGQYGYSWVNARRSAAPAQGVRLAAQGGCGKAFANGMKAGTSVARVITSGGVRRSYRVHVPAGWANKTAAPLVLNFHGRTASGAEQEALSGLVPLSDRSGFILVSPDGTGTPAGWSAGATPPNAIDDVRFVRDLLDSLGTELCVDTGRVYATGFSNGAFMAARLACELPGRITAIAVVGGLDYPGGCQARIPVLGIHGSADTVVPIDGGKVRAWHYAGARTAIREWAETNGCAPEPESSMLAAGVTHHVYVGCLVPAEFVVIEGGAHAWPGAAPADPLSAASLVWEFLSAHRVTVATQ